MSKTTAEKLQIKPVSRVWASHHPHVLGPLPDGATLVDSPAAATVAIVFADDAASLRTLVAAHDLTAPEILWIAYPKGGRSDINRDSVWPILRERGLRPVSQVSLGDVWSALRFRPLAPGETFDPG
jgi:hypothetical protein